jgi:hypothetical protein
MKLKIDKEFKEICKEILNQNKAPEEWALIESSDMFQTEKYNGGYDADEMAFCFSYYDESGKEFWFQITAEEIRKISENKLEELTIREAS